MKFSQFSGYLARIEAESSRITMTEILAEMLKHLDVCNVSVACYMALGRLAPAYQGLELMMAGKLMIRAVAQLSGRSIPDITKQFRAQGDLGEVVMQMTEPTESAVDLSITQVHAQLTQIAQMEGSGSQDRKIAAMVSLLGHVSPLGKKYIVRIALQKLRLGFSEMTLLDAMSWMITGNKDLRPELEHGFNIRADIGLIAQLLKDNGKEAIAQLKPQPGIPIRPAKATAVAKIDDVFEKMEDEMYVEPKYDGLRIQLHFDVDQNFARQETELKLFEQNKPLKAQIFSRNLEHITHMFPDLVLRLDELQVPSIILDGEVIAHDPQTGELREFQDTIKRKRKHNIERIVKEIPVTVFVFDLLFLNGESWLHQPFTKRRNKLEQLNALHTFDQPYDQSRIILAQKDVVQQKSDFSRLFNKVSEQNLEGLMVKKPSAAYQAGARDFTWIKYKVGMQAELADTVDAVIMGYFSGEGKWAEFGIGKVLLGVRSGQDIVAVSKLGSGFSQDQLKALYTKLKPLKTDSKPKAYQVDENLVPTTWVEPEMVVEVRADSVSTSAMYNAGLSLRFPRFVRIRPDKTVNQATSLDQLKSMQS